MRETRSQSLVVSYPSAGFAPVQTAPVVVHGTCESFRRMQKCTHKQSKAKPSQATKGRSVKRVPKSNQWQGGMQMRQAKQSKERKKRQPYSKVQQWHVKCKWVMQKYRLRRRHSTPPQKCTKPQCSNARYKCKCKCKCKCQIPNANCQLPTANCQCHLQRNVTCAVTHRATSATRGWVSSVLISNTVQRAIAPPTSKTTSSCMTGDWFQRKGRTGQQQTTQPK